MMSVADLLTPGDKIVVASTDFDWRQAEVREIVDCRQECSASQIRVDGKPIQTSVNAKDQIHVYIPTEKNRDESARLRVFYRQQKWTDSFHCTTANFSLTGPTKVML